MTNREEIIVTRLKEGAVYPFQVSGLIRLPDNTEHFVLVDPNGVKHLLESIYYQNYHFETGQMISCRIDKINCNGKFFIEPIHPYYRIGNHYDFRIIRLERSDKSNDRVIIFEDIFNNEIKLHFHYFSEPVTVGQILKLKVVRIKRGLVFLSEPGLDEDFSAMKVGAEYQFEIKELIDLPAKRSYFVVVSPEGKKYKIRHKYYEKYGFTIGQSIACKLLKSGKELFLEPEHPFYKINQFYDFEIIGADTLPEYPIGEKKVWMLRNDYGKNVIIPEGNKELLQTGKINCRVKDIRKGKLNLTCRE